MRITGLLSFALIATTCFVRGENIAAESECLPLNILLGKDKSFNCCEEVGIICEDGHVISIYASEENIKVNSIPPEIGNLTNLKKFFLSFTKMSGSIPPELGKLTQLTKLDLSNNQLTGSIPNELGKLTNLEFLDLSNNQLTGSIPPEIGNLTNLEFLGLKDNQLTGSIPTEFKKLTNLQILNMDEKVCGSIPSEVKDLISKNELKACVEPKKMSVLTIILIVLLICLAFISGFLLFSKFKGKSEK